MWHFMIDKFWGTLNYNWRNSDYENNLRTSFKLIPFYQWNLVYHVVYFILDNVVTVKQNSFRHTFTHHWLCFEFFTTSFYQIAILPFVKLSDFFIRCFLYIVYFCFSRLFIFFIALYNSIFRTIHLFSCFKLRKLWSQFYLCIKQWILIYKFETHHHVSLQNVYFHFQF